MSKYTIYAFLVLFVSVVHVNAQNACTNPNNAAGTCIPINSCPPLVELLRNRYRSPAETKFLKDSQCGRQGQNVLVCCVQPRPQGNACTTADNTSGNCVALNSCGYLLELFNGPKPLPQSTLTYLRRSACQGPDRYSVCCGDRPGPTTPPPPEVEVDTSNRADIDALLPNSAECGMESSTDRIFGGNVTSIDQYPWMGLVEYRTRRFTISLGCGSTLISKRYVITAAHCVVGEVLTALGTPINVRLGEFNKTTGVDCVRVAGGEDCNEEPITIGIETIIAHPEYKPSTGSQKNDIAIIRLVSDAPYTDFVRPICLPKSDITQGGSSPDMTVAGWGTKEDGRSSDVKLHLIIQLVSLQQCQVAYDNPRLRAELWEKQICAGGEAGKDSCRGDSGGPLMAVENLQWTLHGVVSFGPSPCALANVPGVYTKVFAYINWIRVNIKP